MRVGYFGPEGTFTHEALIDAVVAADAQAELQAVPLPTIYDTVMAVHTATVDRALVPMENSLEGSVEWSHDLLDARLRALFRRLSIFTGGFTIDAANAVAFPLVERLDSNG